MNEFDMWLDVDGEEVYVEVMYNFLEGDANWGEPDDFELWVKLDGKEIDLSDDERDEVEKQCYLHMEQI